MTTPQHAQSMARDHQLLVSRNHIEPDTTVATGYLLPVRRIGCGIEDGAEPGKPLRDPCTELDGIFADPGGEHESIEAVEGCRHHPGMQPHAIDEMIEGKGGARISGCFEQAHIVAAAGQSLQAALPVEEVFDLGDRHALLVQKMQHHARIELPRPRPHRQPVKRREAERAVDASPLAKGAEGGAAPEMRNDDAAFRSIWRRLPKTLRNIFVGETVTTVAANALRIEPF